MEPTSNESHSQRIVSQLLEEDSDLRDIVAEFVRALPTRIEDIKHAYEALDWDQLSMLAHRLKGASGSYGYPDLSTLAAGMEQAFQAHRADDFSAWIGQLAQYVAAAQAGLPES